MSIQYDYCTWQEDQDPLFSVRFEVFINEQNVPEELEIDEHDPSCQHVLATHNGIAIGTARITTDGYIGRMCVLKAYRKKGVGSERLFFLIKHAFNNNMKLLKLNVLGLSVRSITEFS